MSRLILSLDEQVLAEYNMSKERYTIGRLPDNDVRIDNPAVSGHHSLIINILNDSFLEDLNSTNGTYVNGHLIKKHALQHADVITIGQHQLRFVDQQAAEVDQDEFEKTMVINPKTQEQVALEHVKSAVQEAAPSADGPTNGSGPRLGKLQVLTGPYAGRELDLIKALTTLGQPGKQVAAITRRTEGYYLVHVSSHSPDDFPVVNGARIGGQARKLEDSDVIELAGIKMGFFDV